jgi:hypothetical protein
MKHTPILLLTLVAASAAAAPAAGLNYDRVEVGYLSNDALKGYSFGATAELGHSGVLVSGVYADVDGKGDIAGYGGYETGFGLAYKFNVGPGDLAVGFSYVQGQFGSGSGVAVAEQKGFGVQYRQAIGSSFEVLAGYQRVRTNIGALEVDGFGNIYAGVATSSVNVFNVGVRYNVTSNFDVTLGYTFQNLAAGGDTFAVSAGYSF